MRRYGILLLAMLFLLAGQAPGNAARAEEEEMRIAVSSDEVLPGEAVIVWFFAPEDGECDILVTDGEGEPVAAVAKGRRAQKGYNSLYWNGTWEGTAAPEGAWTLRLEMNGQTAETPVTVGRMMPMLISPYADTDRVTAGKKVTISFWATEAGTAVLSVGDGRLRAETPVETGDGALEFEAALPPGQYTMALTLRREDGSAESQRAEFPLTVEKPATDFTPLGNGRGEDYTLNGWTVPMDITDEDAVWQALTAPVTVLDDGKDKAQVRQAVVRKEPDSRSDGVGMVTLASQGVYVLEKGEEWSRIACYSSSFHDSPILNWNALIEGWVETRLLKTVTPNQDLGLVVDKLTQRLYVFREGGLYTTLQVSTGLANAKQPYNETRAGEYLLVSRVGGFYSDSLFCPRAIRFNDGDLLHEVPYAQKDGFIDYSMTETKLGTRASHGCIRVQRKPNPEGVNQSWLYENYRANTKILIWEDWQGRQIPVPEDGETLWYNPRKNDYYHCSAACKQLGTRAPQEISYGELSAEDCRLKACPACGPIMKKDRLEEYNARYAPGGDHDPVMTEAREDCPKKRKGR